MIGMKCLACGSDDLWEGFFTVLLDLRIFFDSWGKYGGRNQSTTAPKAAQHDVCIAIEVLA